MSKPMNSGVSESESWTSLPFDVVGVFTFFEDINGCEAMQGSITILAVNDAPLFELPEASVIKASERRPPSAVADATEKIKDSSSHSLIPKPNMGTPLDYLPMSIIVGRRAKRAKRKSRARARRDSTLPDGAGPGDSIDGLLCDGDAENSSSGENDIGGQLTVDVSRTISIMSTALHTKEALFQKPPTNVFRPLYELSAVLNAPQPTDLVSSTGVAAVSACMVVSAATEKSLGMLDKAQEQFVLSPLFPRGQVPNELSKSLLSPLKGTINSLRSLQDNTVRLKAPPDASCAACCFGGSGVGSEYATVVVTISQGCFEPRSLSIVEGQTVEWHVAPGV
jgi:hypothetical protein